MKTCGGCTLCCKSLAILELKKPQNRWCEHCSIGSGCQIYELRPPSCRTFSCAYLQIDTMPESLRPDRCHAVISFNEDHVPLIHVDPNTPDVYRRGPIADFIERCRLVGIDVIIVSGDRRKLLANYKDDSPLSPTLKRPEVQSILKEILE